VNTRLLSTTVSVFTKALAFAALLLGIWEKGAVAQDSPQPILATQLSFSNPGARSLGLAGAFVALADDATAAWANPAGLVQITRPEVSVEGRYWEYSTPFVVGGRVTGEPSDVGLDTVSGLRTKDSESDATGLAFLSFVYPAERWSVAVYRHVFANLETQGETEGLFGQGTDGISFRYLDQRTRSILDVISYGFSAAYRITDSFSLGLGLVYYRTRIEIQSDLYLWDDLDDYLGSGTSYLPERFVLGQTIQADDWSLDLSAGLLWRINQRWSLGARYREGPTARLGGQARVGSILDLGVPPGAVIQLDLEEKGNLPDNFGLGVAYRSDDGRLTVGFEWDRVTYSEPLESLEVDDQFIDDADEVHLGGEWAFLQSKPLLALRAGVWHDPDHQTRPNERADDFTRALFQPGEDELHYALGLGAAFKSFQIDGAVDLSDSVKTLSLSAIYSF
jgi:long-subunit fatty acid transport protein